MEFIFHAAHPFFCTFDRKIFTALEKLHSNTPKTLDVLHEQNPAMHLNSKLTKLPPPNEINKRIGTVAVSTVSPVAEGTSSQGIFWWKIKNKSTTHFWHLHRDFVSQIYILIYSHFTHLWILSSLVQLCILSHHLYIDCITSHLLLSLYHTVFSSIVR